MRLASWATVSYLSSGNTSLCTVSFGGFVCWQISGCYYDPQPPHLAQPNIRRCYIFTWSWPRFRGGIWSERRWYLLTVGGEDLGGLVLQLDNSRCCQQYLERPDPSRLQRFGKMQSEHQPVGQHIEIVVSVILYDLITILFIFFFLKLMKETMGFLQEIMAAYSSSVNSFAPHCIP